MKKTKTHERPKWLFYAIVPVITLIVYRSGGYESWLTFLYLIPIIWASLTVSFQMGVGVAVTSCAFYLFMVALDLNQVVPHYPLLPTDISTFQERILFVGTAVLFDKLLIFLALSAIIGKLAESIKKKNKKIEEERNKIKSIFENLEDAVLVTDTDGKVITLNSSANIVFPELGKDPIGVNIKGKLGDTHIEERLLSLCELSHPSIDICFAGPNDAIFEGSLVPLSFGEEVIGRILTCRDVTHKKQIEKMKSDFLAFLSHQLRSPLSNLKLYVEELLSMDLGGLKDEQSESLNTMQHQIARLIELVNYFLDLETIKSGQLKLHLKHEDPAEMIQDVLDEYKDEDANVVFNRSEPELPPVVMDRLKVEEVFRNILKNSIKYLKDGNGEIEVSINKMTESDLHKRLKDKWEEGAPVPMQFLKILNPKKPKDAKEWYDIEIKDDGIGIPKEEQGKIFSEMFRAENAQQEEGMGMGLFLSKAIIVSMGGKICFESEKDKGTTFHISVPVNLDL